MSSKKKEYPAIKSKLHPRNKHRQRYDLQQLSMSCPELAPYVKLNEYGDESINFFDPAAVKMLNKALLKHFYEIDNWDIPPHYLCPPVPGRADHIHYLADLLKGNFDGKIPTGSQIKCLDIGVGANCIYPLIGNKEYGWSFVGSDIDPVAIASAKSIIKNNPSLHELIELRLQPDSNNIFKGVIQKEERFHLSICNPPFHTSLEEAQAGTKRKLRNLKKKKNVKAVLNFGGRSNELWCKGGEVQFIQNMIMESKQFANSCFWFSTLVAKQAHLKNIYKVLKKVNALKVKTIAMGQGNKTSRIVAWTFSNQA